jgi:hypothetical membrane protein
MDFSRLDRRRTIIGGIAAILLLISLFFLPWFSLSHNPTRDAGQGFICGDGDYTCTGFETFPILSWLLLLFTLAPLILAYIVVTDTKLSWSPGEMTMVAGFIAMVLIAYNGLIDKPGSGREEIGVSLDYGYWIALLCSIVIAAVAFLRSLVGAARERKTPGTVG